MAGKTVQVSHKSAAGNGTSVAVGVVGLVLIIL